MIRMLDWRADWLGGKADGSSSVAGRDAVRESGSALVVVVALIALASVLAASSVALSRKSRHMTAALAGKTYSAYVAEGASSRIQWLIAFDRRMHPQRTLGMSVAEDDVAETRYMADGKYREMDYHGVPVRYRIGDMASGVDVSGPGALANLSTLKSLYEGDTLERYEAFLDKFEDYGDSNDLVRLKGMEADGYAESGLGPLPRNRPLEFKEEILLIPGALEFFQADAGGRLSSIRVVPPRNLPRVGSQNNFFGASKETIMASCGMSQEDAEMVVQARDLWFENGSDISLSLDVGVFTQLRSKFSFNESGFYSIEVDSSPRKDRAGRKLHLTCRISNQFANPGTRYYEWFSY